MNELAPASHTSVAERPSSGALSILSGGRPETAKALVSAIVSCHSVGKESQNSFHGYRYASADAILEEGRKALAGAGLALVPLEASLNGSEREGADRFELVRTFVLIHSSGECTPLRVVWPVVPGQGRPLDKATAAADTSSLAYLLRDLLLMPRVEPGDDVSGRDDRPAAQQKPAADQAARGKKLRERIEARELQLVAEGRCKRAELWSHVVATVRKAHGSPVPTDLAEWDKPRRQTAIDAVIAFEALHPVPEARANGTQKPPRVTEDQVNALNEELQLKGKSWRDVLQKFNWPAGKVMRELSVPEWQGAMSALGEHPDVKAGARG